MTPSARATEKRHWYKVNVDTLRGTGIFVLLVALAAGGFFGYRILQTQFLEREVEIVIAEAQGLVASLRGETGIDAYSEEYETAQVSLEQARGNAAEGQLGEALRDAEHSRGLLTSILNALRHRVPAGEAQFIAAQGGVEYRRGEGGDWQPARSMVTLYAGDYVKTASGASAEVMFQDGTVVTVRPDTVILVDRSRSLLGFGRERSVALEYGWVNLSTAQGVGKVRTPSASAVVREESQAVVTYDESSRTGRFATYQGKMQVSTDDGRTQEVSELQQVVQTGRGALSRPEPLPEVPKLAQPQDGAVFALADGKMVLEWRPVQGARSYALQVSRSARFVDNVIDVSNRQKAAATVGLRGEGSFVWRVAAVAGSGIRGPWSEPRGFRVAGAAAAETG